MDVILEGRLIRLRPLEANDAELTFQWRHSERAQYLNPGAPSIEAQREWILRNVQSGDMNFIIEYKEVPVGMIALVDINYIHRSFSVGRLLIGDEATVGNAPVVFDTETVLLDYAFETLNMHSMYGEVMGTNTGVLKLRKYLRYQQAGVFKEHYCVNGEYVDSVLFSLLKDDYYKRCRRIMKATIDMYFKSHSGEGM